jgi:hypothetical protein
MNIVRKLESNTRTCLCRVTGLNSKDIDVAAFGGVDSERAWPRVPNSKLSEESAISFSQASRDQCQKMICDASKDTMEGT